MGLDVPPGNRLLRSIVMRSLCSEEMGVASEFGTTYRRAPKRGCSDTPLQCSLLRAVSQLAIFLVHLIRGTAGEEKESSVNVAMITPQSFSLIEMHTSLIKLASTVSRSFPMVRAKLEQ